MKMLRVIAGGIASGLLLAGCVFGGSELPTATATLHWAKVDLPRGSYCWTFSGRGECADSAGPEQLLKTGYLKPYGTAGGFDAVVAFNRASEPTSFRVDLVYGPAQPASLPVQAPRTFAVPQVPAAGVYVYLVSTRWPEGDVAFFLALDLVPGIA